MNLFERTPEQLLDGKRACIQQIDAIEWLAGLTSNSVDLIITDPAYESLEKHRAVGTTTRLTKEWFPIFENHRFEDFFRQAYRVLRRDRHFYMMCDQETMFVVKPIAEKVGFKFWKPLVWDKQKIGMGYHYRARYEFVLFFEKGKRRLNDLGIPDVLDFPRVIKGYPTEKPVELSRLLIRQSTEPGMIVADPFLGSGSTMQAALEASCSFIGCDIEEKSIAIAPKRVMASGVVRVLEPR